MKKHLSKILIAALAFLMFNCQASDKKENRVLIFAKTMGYHHGSIEKAIVILKQACTQEGMIADTTRNADVFTTDNLKNYKVVVFLNTSGDIFNEAQQTAFEKYIQSGGGFVGIHAATDTEYEWQWYNKLVGAYFLSHPNQQKATINVTDKNNVATSFLPEKWERTDEWYNFKNINPDIKVLAYLDETTYTGGQNGQTHPFIWCHEFDGGRAFYSGVGHRDDNYDEPLVIKHLIGAIQWAGKIK